MLWRICGVDKAEPLWRSFGTRQTPAVQLPLWLSSVSKPLLNALRFSILSFTRSFRSAGSYCASRILSLSAKHSSCLRIRAISLQTWPCLSALSKRPSGWWLSRKHLSNYLLSFAMYLLTRRSFLIQCPRYQRGSSRRQPPLLWCLHPWPRSVALRGYEWHAWQHIMTRTN